MYMVVSSEFVDLKLAVIEHMVNMTDNLETQIVHFANVANENMNKVVETNEQQLKNAKDWLAWYHEMHEDMKKLMANNLELTTQNGNLQQELNLARKDALLLCKEALL